MSSRYADRRRLCRIAASEPTENAVPARELLANSAAYIDRTRVPTLREQNSEWATATAADSCSSKLFYSKQNSMNTRHRHSAKRTFIHPKVARPPPKRLQVSPHARKCTQEKVFLWLCHVHRRLLDARVDGFRVGVQIRQRRILAAYTHPLTASRMRIQHTTREILEAGIGARSIN
jgi:hypothetical protein